jgi:hypothetical protein
MPDRSVPASGLKGSLRGIALAAFEHHSCVVLEHQSSRLRLAWIMRWAILFMATLVLLTGVAIAVAATAWGYAAAGAGVGGLAVLLAHQRLTRWTVWAGLLGIAAFVAPPLLVRPTWSSEGCRSYVPCDRASVGHPGLQITVFAVLLTAAMGAALYGFIRSRIRSLA